MLIVLGRAKVSEGTVEAARDAIAAMVAASNAEEGCISYAFAQDVVDPSVIHIVEQWVDDAALLAHFQAPHMGAFREALSTLDFSLTTVAKYQSDEGSPLG